jgi:hypothetical protein
MIIKSGGICYLFDFDGTICGKEDYEGFFKSIKEWFKSGPYIKPDEFDIRWSILTGRPKMDKPIIRTYCAMYGLMPEVILTIPTFFYPFKSNEEKWKWKLDTIKKIVQHKIPELCSLRPLMISNVIYIDNDLNTIKYMNSNKKGETSFIAATVRDFIKEDLELLL